MTDLSHIQVLVPEDCQDAGDLPMGLLDSASNHLKCDLIDAVKGEVPGMKYAAWIELCYQWARHVGVEGAKRETYRDYKVEEISHALGWDRLVEEAEEAAVDPMGPTQPLEQQTGDLTGGSSVSRSLASSVASPLT